MNEKHTENRCVICLDDKPKYACIPCGHQCLCEQCKDSVTDICPVCRHQFDSVFKIFS